MLKKMMNYRIQKRLLTSSIVTSAIMLVASIIAIIVIIYSSGQYSRVLTYYAFPQGDIGHAMTALADVRSCTRGAIGYEEQELVDKMIVEHDARKADVEYYLQFIRESIVTEVGRESMQAIEDSINAYFAIDQKVLELGTINDAELYKQAQSLAMSEMAPAYKAAYEALESLMTANISLGD